ncbi:MAG: cation:proton antiporter [Candidatus Thorarchaeota archaeon]|jgi:Kef-type K+ transport system membrane component KefB
METILFIIGASLVLAYIGAYILKRIGVPQTLGFMIAGVVLGITGLATTETIDSLRIIVSLALGLIGYNIGHELKSDKLKGRISKLSVIVIFEASAAFALVSILTFMITQQWHVAFLFGAVASATAPAATADVVWESSTEGPLTSSLMFVLAADDMVAVILTNSAIAYALWFYNPTSATLLIVLLEPALSIIIAAIVGAVFGVIYLYPVNREKDRGKLLELELGMVILLIGVILVLSDIFGVRISEIFATMVFGFMIGKFIDEDKEHIPDLLQRIMAPIVMIFFALVGARMAQLLTVTTTLIAVIITATVYLAGRTSAKYVGTIIGATVVNEQESVRKYLGSSLFCQAGVALGLSFIIEEEFVALGGAAAEIGILVLSVVALSTMVLEVIGPIAVKYSLRKAGELPEGVEPFEPHEFIKFKVSANDDDKSDLQSIVNDENDDES